MRTKIPSSSARFKASLLLAGLTVVLGVPLLAQRSITLEDRVRAQEAIERVYYEHRIWPKENPGPKPPFEQMISRAQIEAKVEDYLKKSAALEKFWQRPITAEQLQAEMDRMAKQTKDPETLRELFAALGNDPYMIAECLARPILADRLIRNWYANDERFHGETRRRAEEARQYLSPENFCPPAGAQHHKVTYRLENEAQGIETHSGEMEAGMMALSQAEFEKRWDESRAEGEISDIQETLEAFIIQHTLRKTDHEIKLESLSFPKKVLETWLESLAGSLKIEKEGAESVYSLSPIPELSCVDGWDNGILDDVPPEPRHNHTAVWTGMEMIVYGGWNGASYFNSGGRYNPAIDSWIPTSTGVNVPAARYYHTAVWTGTEMIVWGGWNGSSYFNTGGRYDPSTDSWIPTSTGVNVPSARYGNTAEWTGTEMIVWGGWNGSSYFNTGGRYDPATDSWIPTSMGANVPVARYYHTTVWTGTEMIIWGGYGSSPTYKNDGGRYNPATDSWIPTSMGVNVPAARYYHTAVWTGTEMIIWGGYGASPTYKNDGRRYDPSADSWIPTSMGLHVPSARYVHTAVWTGAEMIVWGGYGASPIYKNDGGRYNPSADSWSPTSIGAGVPSARESHTAVWTGAEMIIWGGYGSSPARKNDGGRYDPSTDSWVPTSVGIAASFGYYLHTAIWTGMEMIVWGGYGATEPYYHNNGGRYNPSTDSWIPTSTGADVSSGRMNHTAVWTGAEMVVWGGRIYKARWDYLNTGGRYNPTTDTWIATSTGANVPSGRDDHTAIWTGSEMIVWGGDYYDTSTHCLNTGGWYNPARDSWIPVSMVSAPAERYGHTAAWTGKEMIVWGGSNGLSLFDTGGRYDAFNDSWFGTSTGINMPSARRDHAAIWTGAEMIIWGGYGTSSTCMNDGGRYNPTTDTWIATSTGANAPSARCRHTAIWTGLEMIVWGGGYTFGPFFNTGGRYDPSTDSWIPTSIETGVPLQRFMHTAIWTGAEMIVWGGTYYSGGLSYIYSGGRYNPYGLSSQPTISGNSSNTCPGTFVPLSADGVYSSYQWYWNGIAIPAATASTYNAGISGDYRVAGMADTEGCWGLSDQKAVAIAFCSTTEVSPQGSPVPLRIVRNPASSTGFYLYFEKIPSAAGYDIYKGTIGSWYGHGGAFWNVCNAAVADLGTGEMRAELNPSGGDHYYLVTAYGGGTEGPSGFDSSGVEIPQELNTCPP